MCSCGWHSQHSQLGPLFTVISCHMHLLLPCSACAELSIGWRVQTCELSFLGFCQLFSSAAHLLVQTSVSWAWRSSWASQDFC